MNNKIPTLKELDETLKDVYENPGSKIFLANKTELKRLLTTKKGLQELAGNKLEEDNVLSETFEPIFNSKKWRSVLEKWYEKTIEARDVTHVVDRPRNIQNFQTAIKSVPGPNHTYQADLMHMDWFNPDKNLKRFHFALVVVDVYSTFLYLYPVRRKNAENMSVVLEKFFKDTKKTKDARYLWTDLGGEFFNKKSEAVYKKWNTQHYHTKSMQKAYLAERKIRQLKTFLNEDNRSGLL